MKAGWGRFRARFQENIIVHVLEWVFPLGVRFILEQVQWGKVHSRTRFPGGILTILREGLAQHSKGISSISSSTWSQNSSNSLSSQTDFRLQSSSGSSRSTPFSWAVNQVNPPPPFPAPTLTLHYHYRGFRTCLTYPWRKPEIYPPPSDDVVCYYSFCASWIPDSEPVFLWEIHSRRYTFFPTFSWLLTQWALHCIISVQY